MNHFVRSLFFASVVILLALGSNVDASDKPVANAAQEMFGPHDGPLTKTKRHAFEVVFAADGLCVYMFDVEIAPMMMQRVKATAVVSVTGTPVKEVPLKLDAPKDGEKILYFCPMHPSVAQSKPGKCEACGGMELIPQDCIRAAIDLSKAAPGSVSAVITIKGMKGEEPDAVFTTAWTPAPKK